MKILTRFRVVNLENQFFFHLSILKFVDFQPHGKKVARNENFINSASFPLLFVTIYFVFMVKKISQPKVALKLSQNWYFPLNLFFKLQPMRDGWSKRGGFVEFESEMRSGFLAASFFQ